MTRALLIIALVGVGCATDYNRKDWKHWIDEDGDCQSTRHEVLAASSKIPVTYRDGCSVETGEWYDPYSGQTFTSSKDLDIDHFIPLSNAHRSGGWRWSPEKKKLYANDMNSKDHLIAVKASLNRQKSDKGPEEWLPPNEGYVCEYVKRWREIKMRWGLTMNPDEDLTVQRILSGCK